jgi:hypothetical protein
MDVLWANLMGILSELNLVDEASDAARDAVPLMRRTGNWFLEEWAHLFWRRGQPEIAATLIGAAEALTVKSASPIQANEKRLIEQARQGVAAALPSEAMERYRAAGAALDDERVPALLSDSLQKPLPKRR